MQGEGGENLECVEEGRVRLITGSCTKYNSGS